MAFNRFFVYCRYRLRIDLVLLLLFSLTLFLLFLSLKNYYHDDIRVTENAKLVTPITSSGCFGEKCLLASDGLRDVVILLSYMRSGSTLLGQIISSSPEVFYLFEPFRVIHRFLENGSSRTYNTIMGQNFVFWYKNWFAKLTSCDFHSTILNPRFMDVSSKRWYLENEQAHMIRQSSFKIDPIRLQNNGTFIAMEEERCDSSQLLTIKTIRITDLDLVWKTFQNSGVNLKIVHLVRDPRAVENSRMSLGDKRNLGPRWVCDWPINNLKFIQSLLSNGASNVKPFYYELKYEDLAQNPLSETSKLFGFLNLKMSPATEKLVLGLTNSTERKFGGWEATGRNILTTMDNWKTALSSGRRKIIESDPKCQELMTFFGYNWPFVS